MCDVDAYDRVHKLGPDNGSSGGGRPTGITSHTDALEPLGPSINFIDNWLQFIKAATVSYSIRWYLWPHNFSQTSVQSLLYTPISLIFSPLHFLCLPPLVLSVRGLGEHVCSAQMKGGGRGHMGDENCFLMCV